MHKIIFGLKKAHLGAVGFGRRELSAVPGMTPARYDLLYAIRMVGSSILQSRLRRKLGLHPSTVSKMITRLIEIGWLDKNLGGKHGRSNTIHLTAAGFYVIELARRIVEKRREVRYWFDEALRPGNGGWRAAHEVIFQFWLLLETMADAFDRRAHLIYPPACILDD